MSHTLQVSQATSQSTSYSGIDAQRQKLGAAQTAQSVSTDGADREHDGDGDDRASVTPTRGQNVNTVA